VSEIVPRWEWRTFDETFGMAEERLKAAGPTRISEREELYIVSSRSEASVKVRGGHLDVKELVQVGDDGLEQWRPVARAEFPIAASEVASVLSVLGVRVPRPARDAYELDELVGEVVGPSPDLLPVSLRKRRAHFTFGG
jgi:exopolyphosphatase/guanosine-5'-triphosphate,3'-diphosphate pyrophosphatase